jgi:hypothetical protein
MAQPLTVVRGAIEVLQMPHIAERDPKRYLQLVSQQTERACFLFGCLQDLLATRLVEARRDSFDWLSLVTALTELRTTKLRSDGITLALTNLASWRPVYGDAQRAERAVSASLDAAAEMASPGDTIHLLLDSTADCAELTISNPRAQIRCIDSSARLYLSLAEESILSQSGNYRFSESPFCVSLSLPVDRSIPIRMSGELPTVHRPQLQ